MQALAVGPPRLGPVVAQDANGCYQVILFKRSIAGVVHREVSLSIVTVAKRRPVTYTRAVPYLNAGLDLFISLVQSEVAAFVRSNS